MKNLRICIYGGTDLQGSSPEFTTTLVYTLLDSIPGCTIITGGFIHSNQYPNSKSTDVAALEGARQYANKHGINLNQCFEAWIPEPSLDSRQDVKGVLRMNESQGITIRVMHGRTPLGRRLAMVSGVDLVVTISGKRHTEVVVEQALELGLPVFPIPNFGGDSKMLFNKYKNRLSLAFGPGKLENCLKMLNALIDINYKKAALAVVELVRTAKLGKCLILLPYDEQHNLLYDSIVEPAVANHMIPVRLDKLPGSEAIYTNFTEAIRSASAVIADITQLNENVMYEVGYAHGFGLTPLIYTQEADRLDKLPVYFRTLNVQVADKNNQLKQLINEYLSSIKARRRLSIVKGL